MLVFLEVIAAAVGVLVLVVLAGAVALFIRDVWDDYHRYLKK